MIDLENQLCSLPQPFREEASEAYFQTICSTLKSDFLVLRSVIDTLTDLTNALSTSNSVISTIFDKKESEIAALHQRLDSLIAVESAAKFNS